jgi:predicted 2-oxoglutarate/Fe(II)-dependent dioxygenase YbiX
LKKTTPVYLENMLTSFSWTNAVARGQSMKLLLVRIDRKN